MSEPDPASAERDDSLLVSVGFYRAAEAEKMFLALEEAGIGFEADFFLNGVRILDSAALDRAMYEPNHRSSRMAQTRIRVDAQRVDEVREIQHRLFGHPSEVQETVVAGAGSEDTECLSCGATIPSFQSRCRACGWSYENTPSA